MTKRGPVLYRELRGKSVSEVFCTLVDEGFSPALISDGNGEWAVSCSMSLNAGPIITTRHIIPARFWRPSIGEAVDFFLEDLIFDG